MTTTVSLSSPLPTTTTSETENQIKNSEPQSREDEAPSTPASTTNQNEAMNPDQSLIPPAVPKPNPIPPSSPSDHQHRRRRPYLPSDSLLVYIPQHLTVDLGTAMKRVRNRRVQKLEQLYPSLLGKKRSRHEDNENNNENADNSMDDDNKIEDMSESEQPPSGGDDDSLLISGKKKKRKTNDAYQDGRVPKRDQYGSILDYLEAKYVKGVMIDDLDERIRRKKKLLQKKKSDKKKKMAGKGKKKENGEKEDGDKSQDHEDEDSDDDDDDVKDDAENGDDMSILSDSEAGSCYSDSSGNFLDDSELKSEVAQQIVASSAYGTTKIEAQANKGQRGGGVSTEGDDEDAAFFVNVGDLEMEDGWVGEDYDSEDEGWIGSSAMKEKGKKKKRMTRDISSNSSNKDGTSKSKKIKMNKKSNKSSNATSSISSIKKKKTVSSSNAKNKSTSKGGDDSSSIMEGSTSSTKSKQKKKKAAIASSDTDGDDDDEQKKDNDGNEESGNSDEENDVINNDDDEEEETKRLKQEEKEKEKIQKLNDKKRQEEEKAKAKEEVVSAKKKAAEMMKKVKKSYKKCVEEIKNLNKTDMLPRKPKKGGKVKVSITVPQNKKGGDTITFSNPHVLGQKLRVQIPADRKAGGKFVVSVPKPEVSKTISKQNKFSKSCTEALDKYSSTYDLWCQLEAKYRSLLPAIKKGKKLEPFKAGVERLKKYDEMLKEFPKDLLIPIDAVFLRKLVRRTRQNTNKRLKALAAAGESAEGANAGTGSGSGTGTVVKKENEDIPPETVELNVPLVSTVFPTLKFDECDFTRKIE